MLFAETPRGVSALQGLRPGRNGYDALPPSPEMIRRATAWIEGFRWHVKGWTGVWLTPHVNASADGDVVFEWWAGERKLTVYVESSGTTCVMSWGCRMDTEMEDGDLGTPESEHRAWQWLVG